MKVEITIGPGKVSALKKSAVMGTKIVHCCPCATTKKSVNHKVLKGQSVMITMPPMKEGGGV